MRRTANLATFWHPERLDSLPRALESIYHQVDEVRVCLNGYQEVPPGMVDSKITVMIPSTDLGASGKFAWADMPQEYYFTVDDDIVYPPDYVTHYVNMMGRYQNRVILTSHGVMPRPHAKSYFKERSVISFRAGQWRDVRVAVGGTGVMMFCTENFRVRLNDFLAANLADLSVACRGVAYCS